MSSKKVRSYLMATMQCFLVATIKNYLVAAAITTRVLVIPFSQMAGFVLTNLLIHTICDSPHKRGRA